VGFIIQSDTNNFSGLVSIDIIIIRHFSPLILKL
jgi:hypothetical protein